MGAETPDKLSALAAEEILRTIFGDDLHGCPVSLDAVAKIIHQTLQQRSEEDRDLIDMYENLVHAIDLLSTPPASEQVSTPEALRSLLGERLDAIHALTQKTQKTTDSLKTIRQSGAGS